MTDPMTVRIVAQEIEVLADRFDVAFAEDPVDAADAVLRVDAPDGLSVVRRSADGGWRALFTGASAHGVDVPGMTVSLLAPLAAAGISVFVTSTVTADLVLVASDDLAAAVGVLRAAGHTVRDAA